jgi:hypothetical protein
MARRLALALFVLGVTCAVGLGCLIAAYDLWGGVPRRLWWLARVLGVLAVSLLVAGGTGWLRTFPPSARGKAAFRAVLVMAAIAAAAGAALWFHFVALRQSSRLVCAPALVAPTRAERDRALAEGLGPLFPVIDPHHSCWTLLRERDELQRDGRCPLFVMDDVPCLCGDRRWEPRTATRCESGPTVCSTRGSAFGCADEGSRYYLEEARRALAERGQ